MNKVSQLCPFGVFYNNLYCHQQLIQNPSLEFMLTESKSSSAFDIKMKMNVS